MRKIKFRAYIILPVITLVCLIGFIGSYIFPNKVLDTYVINMTEKEGEKEFLLPLAQDDTIAYETDTGALSMRGIQVGVCKQGFELSRTDLIYNVYKDGICISQNRYAVSQGDNEQYVYLPFDQYEKCTGKLRIEFTIQTTEKDVKDYPALRANHNMVSQSTTYENGEVLDGALKCSHIFTHDTYPFLYDMRILTFVFLAASMTVSYPFIRKKGGLKYAR